MASRTSPISLPSPASIRVPAAYPPATAQIRGRGCSLPPLVHAGVPQSHVDPPLGPISSSPSCAALSKFVVAAGVCRVQEWRRPIPLRPRVAGPAPEEASTAWASTRCPSAPPPLRHLHSSGGGRRPFPAGPSSSATERVGPSHNRRRVPRLVVALHRRRKSQRRLLRGPF
uniref:Predicted protein n=1 Tax=Hordeum vulgare subsp. vulgare TaxID=112509 RepID=F2D3S5_HORVV|nr:predicted protein [Hordeum vulgare subsp. vulgare]